jgi:D-alanyl-lipoteichoic acid acyltransferase DltB (MBOAT superfamily)
MKVRNTFIIFLVSGFWHGANWTFIFWGFLNAVFFLPLLLFNKNRSNLDSIAVNRYFPSSKEFFQILITFSLTSFAWIFFRSPNVNFAFQYIENIFSGLSQKEDYLLLYNYFMWEIGLLLPFFLLFLIFVEWSSRNNNHGLENTALTWNPVLRIGFYHLIVILILFSFQKQQSFIYFQF